jgi:phosphoglucosamine mutase
MSLHRTQVGDRYIVEQMRSSGAVFGGEPSGHLVFKQHSTTGDGILAALKVIEAMKFYKKELSELAAEVELYPQMLLNTVIARKLPFESVPAIQAAVKEAEKELHGTGRLLLRYSGTEHLARVMVEGQNAELVKKICHQLKDVVAKQLG